jgi:hypothetical protein
MRDGRRHPNLVDAQVLRLVFAISTLSTCDSAASLGTSSPAFAGVFDRFPDLQLVTGRWGELVLFYLEPIATPIHRPVSSPSCSAAAMVVRRGPTRKPKHWIGECPI